MKFGSLFAGIGGFDLGLERAGMECAWQVEIDPFCNKVLEKHWPKVKRYKDVREVGKHNLEPVELICGGFPCQPHSVAGKRKGAADDRNLWPEYLRIIKEIRPRWVIGENVPGIITTMLDQVLSDLESAGYTVETLIIPACAFNAPHRRDRVFVVGYSESQSIDERNYQRETSRTQASKLGNTSSEANVADSEGMRSGGWNSKECGNGKREILSEKQKRYKVGCEIKGCGIDVSNSTKQRLEGQIATRINGRKQGLSTECNWWSVEPNVGRVADGIPSRVDRLKSLGNAVVPQVVEWIGKRIMEIEHE